MSVTMKRTFFAAAALLLSCHFLAAIEWPLPDAVMTRNFGFNDRGRPVLGTVFEGEGVLAAASGGELVFSRTGKDDASRLPSTFGAWTAIDHGDGLVSIYGRYRAGDKKQQLSSWVSQGAAVAGAGISGWSRNNGFYFLLFDRKERRFLNPSMVITPFPDTVQPQILGIQLRRDGERAETRSPEGGQLRGLSQGRYVIMVNGTDSLLDPKGPQLAPHRIVSSVNGEEAGSLSFETISARDGVLMVNRNGLIPASRVYAPWPAFEAGEVYLNRGQAILEIIVQDIAGNSRSAVIRMIVE